MPQRVPLDSLRTELLGIGGRTNNVIFPVYSDPIATGNNYNFVVTINGLKDNSYTLWNDNANNGTVNQRPIGRGIQFKRGDNVTVEMQVVDNSVYEYYYTLSELSGNGPGGGTTPTNPPNNITGGALGVFSAHASEIQSIIIP